VQIYFVFTVIIYITNSVNEAKKACEMRVFGGVGKIRRRFHRMDGAVFSLDWRLFLFKHVFALLSIVPK